MNNSLIKKIILTNFRNFSIQKLEFSSPFVLLAGDNGTGKTNILESLTLLGRNPSLRNGDFEEMIKIGEENFTIYSEISNHEFIEKIAVNFASKKKTFTVNDSLLSSKRQSDLKNYLINFICLTPQLEQLFILGKSARRDYLDHIVCDINPDHQSRLNSYQKLLKERLLILQQYRNQKSADKWLDIVENNIVESGTAIAFARIEAIEFFNKAIASFSSNFPKPLLKISGEIEEMANKENAVKLETIYKDKLKSNRQEDLNNFKTAFGVHRSDFIAIFQEKEMSAVNCSTGEQKSIMIGITLARSKISANYKNQPTILIFDEVVSHLDEKRKKDLLAEIIANSIPCFFSATSFDLIPEDYRKQLQTIKIS